MLIRPVIARRYDSRFGAVSASLPNSNTLRLEITDPELGSAAAQALYPSLSRWRSFPHVRDSLAVTISTPATPQSLYTYQGTLFRATEWKSVSLGGPAYEPPPALIMGALQCDAFIRLAEASPEYATNAPVQAFVTSMGKNTDARRKVFERQASLLEHSLRVTVTDFDGALAKVHQASYDFESAHAQDTVSLDGQLNSLEAALQPLQNALTAFQEPVQRLSKIKKFIQRLDSSATEEFGPVMASPTETRSPSEDPKANVSQLLTQYQGALVHLNDSAVQFRLAYEEGRSYLQERFETVTTAFKALQECVKQMKEPVKGLSNARRIQWALDNPPPAESQ